MVTKFTKNSIILEKLQTEIHQYRNHLNYLEIHLEQSEITAISFCALKLNSVNCHFDFAGGIRA